MRHCHTWWWLAVALLAGHDLEGSRAAEPAPPARLLVVTVTTGFRHASIATAEPALEEIGRTSGLFHVDFLRMPPGRPEPPKAPRRAADMGDEAWARRQEAFQAARETFQQADAGWQQTVREQFARVFMAESLAQFDGVIFANTTGELPLPDLAGFLEWIKAGKAFIGLHAATDTLKSSDAYVEMIGGSFSSHPWNASGEHAFVVHEPDHPLVSMFAERFRWQDEIYRYDLRFEPRNLRVLVSLDMLASAPKEPWHVPVAWVRDYGKGRVFYTNFGHRDETWREPRFREHVQQGIAWALGRRDAPAEPNPDVQAAEYVRSAVPVAAAAVNRSADDLLAKANARIAADPSWAAAQRRLLLELRGPQPIDAAAVLRRLVADIETP